MPRQPVAVVYVDAECDRRGAIAARYILVDGALDDDAVHRRTEIFDRVIAASDSFVGKIGRTRRLIDDEV
jgi:hypothetical protein